MEPTVQNESRAEDAFFDILKEDYNFQEIHPLQEQLFEELADYSFPTTRDELWKYTRVTKISNKTFALGADVDAELIKKQIQVKDNQLVFVNGVYNARMSRLPLKAGLTVDSLLEEGLESDFPYEDILDVHPNLFTISNLVFPTGGVLIAVEPKTEITEAITILHVSTSELTMAQPQFILSVAPFSKLTIDLKFVSLDASECFVNSTLTAFVGDNANLTVNKWQNLDESSFHVCQEYIAQEKDSTINFNTITTDGSLTRNSLTVEVNGKNCNTNLNGVYALEGQKLVDNHTVVDHKEAHCESNELYKGVLSDKSIGVFNGKVFVRKDAQKINAFQSNGTILLTDDAQMNSKPELEIYADDVKCSHGCTTGQLDEEALFYLRARGIGAQAAKQLMVHAFIGEVFGRMDNEEFTSEITALISERITK